MSVVIEPTLVERETYDCPDGISVHTRTNSDNETAHYLLIRPERGAQQVWRKIDPPTDIPYWLMRFARTNDRREVINEIGRMRREKGTAMLNTSFDLVHPDMTLGEFFMDHYARKQFGDLKGQTQQGALGDWNRYFFREPLPLAKCRLRELCANPTLTRHFREMLETQRVKPAGILAALKLLRRLLNVAKKKADGALGLTPWDRREIDMPSGKRKGQVIAHGPWVVEWFVAQILARTDRTPDEKLRSIMLIRLTHGYGGRPGESRPLRLKTFDLDNQTVWIAEACREAGYDVTVDEDGNTVFEKRDDAGDPDDGTKTGPGRDAWYPSIIGEDVTEFCEHFNLDYGDFFFPDALKQADMKRWTRNDYNHARTRVERAHPGTRLIDKTRLYDLARHSHCSLRMCSEWANRPAIVAAHTGHKLSELLDTYSHPIPGYENRVDVNFDEELRAARLKVHGTTRLVDLIKNL